MAGRVAQRRARHGAEGGDEAVDLRVRERLALHEDGGERRAPPAGRGSDENVAGRIVHPEIAERVTRRRHVPGRTVRLAVVVELAELGGEDPVPAEMLEAVLDGLARVTVALGGHVGAGSGRG